MTEAVQGVTEQPVPAQPDPVTPPAKEQPKPTDPRIAHLARQQKAIRAEQAKLQAEREAFAAEKAEVEQAKAWKSRLSQGDYDALSEFGITKDQLTQYLVNQPNPTDRAVMEMKAQLASMQEKQELTQKQIADQTQRNYDQAVAQITTETKLLVSGNPEKYELLEMNGAHDAAVELIKKTFDTEGYVMTVEDACNEVEEYLLEESLKLMNSKKLKAKFAPEAPAEQFVDVPKDKKVTFSTAVRDMPKATVNTLTHQQIPSPTQKPLSSKDRRERAILAFQNKLNS